jgi:hypothetical protein
MGLFLYRAMGAAMLDHSMYEGIEADRSINLQAVLVILLSSLAAGFGAGGWLVGDQRVFVGLSVFALITWLLFAVLTHQIGTHILPEADTHATLGELLRTVGFAAAPGLLFVFAAFPGVTVPIFVGATAWMFAAMVVGVRHALDYSSSARAVTVCAIAFAITTVVAITVAMLLERTVSSAPQLW